MSTEFDYQRYLDAAHQMQAGVKWDQETGSDDGTPKHLRVGINSAQVNNAAIARLLIEKGIITDKEYVRAVREEMEKEVERYKKLLKDKLGVDVELI